MQSIIIIIIIIILICFRNSVYRPVLVLHLQTGSHPLMNACHAETNGVNPGCLIGYQTSDLCLKVALFAGFVFFLHLYALLHMCS